MKESIALFREKGCKILAVSLTRKVDFTGVFSGLPRVYVLSTTCLHLDRNGPTSPDPDDQL